MTTQDYEKIKGEIADEYIKKFKDELGWFKSLTVWPIEGKLKKIMISDKDLEGKSLTDLDDLGRWRNILGAITPSIASDIFDFLKEKQSLIVKAETANKLEDLRSEVVLGIVAADTKVADTKVDDTKVDDTKKDETKIDDTKVDETTGSRNSVENGVTVGVTSAAAYKTMEKTVTKYNDMKLKKQLDFEVSSASAKEELGKLSDKMNELSKYTDDATKNPKLSRAVRNNLSKSSKKFAEVADGMADEGVISAWKARGKLGKDIPAEILNTMDPKAAEKFADLGDDAFEQIAKSTSTDDITKILAKEGITDVKPEMLDILKNMDEAENIKAFSKILKFGKKLSPILKGISCVGAIDLLFFGFDVWAWNESMNEADFVAKINESRASVKRERANFELIMGAASIALEIGIIWVAGAVGGTAGSVVPGVGNAVGFVIGVVVGVVIFVVQDMVDQLYYDKLEFYTQNKEDYIRQDRTGIKQAILQCAKEQEVDANPNLTDTALNEKGINTFQDAWEALIFQEELDKYDKGLLPTDTKLSLIKTWYAGGTMKSDYIATLSAEDKIERDKERETMDKLIASRMEYVKQFITKEGGSEKYERFMENIQASTGLSYIEKIVGESDIYVEMNDTTNEYLTGFTGTVNEYRTKLGENLKTEYPDEYAIFENLYTTDINKFEYLCTGINAYTIANETIYTETELTAIKKNKEFVKEFYHYKKLGLTVENTKNVTIDYTDYDYNYVERVLIDLDQIDTMSNFNDENVIDYFSKRTGIEARLKTDYQVSSSTGQNILYRMAREFHGYTGNNDMFELMSFFDEASDDTKGIYYDDEWSINNDENTRGGDRWYNSSPTQFFLGGVIGNAIVNRFSTIDRDWDLDDIDKKNMTSDDVYDKFDDVLMLDSKVDVADKEAVTEFRAEIKKIIEEEIAAKAPEKKKEVETQIVDFVKAQSQALGETSEVAEDGSLTYSGTTKQGYVEIPYNLVIAAKKAKIGDIENFLFKYEDGKIVAVSSKQYVDTSLDFDQELISYEKVTPLRETLTEEENAVIAKVDTVKKRLSLLRSVESAREGSVFGGHEDEIDIPIEIEREMTKKVYEREDLKESLLYLDITEAKSKLLENRSGYYEYFNGTYMGMLATISQFTMNNNLGSFARMSQARARIGQEKYKIDEKGEVNFDHLSIEDDEKEYIVEYIKKTYQGETKTVEELLKSDDEDEKQKGERMLDQIMISVFEAETLYVNATGDNIVTIQQGKYSYDQDVKNRVDINLVNTTYVSITDTLAEIDNTKVVTETQEIKKVTEVEKNVYEGMNTTLVTIVDTMNNVDRGHGRGEIKFISDDKESTEGNIVGTVDSWGSKRKVTIDIKNSKYMIDGLNYVFTDVEEFAYATNFINRIEGYYLKQNPEMKGMFFFGDFTFPNTLFADRKIDTWFGKVEDPNDVDILYSDALLLHFGWLESGNESNREKFLSIINNL